MDEHAKAEVRQVGRTARRGLTDAERRVANGRLSSHLLALRELAGSPTVLAYAALPDEAAPTVALEVLAARGSQLLYPRVRGVDLEVVPVTDATDLRPGHRGIAEPTGAAADPAAVDVVLVPGVAFDERGGRLGQGGGHYDRLLPTLRADALRIGVAYACQVVAEVPRAPHDAVVDVVVTERGAAWTGARGDR